MVGILKKYQAGLMERRSDCKITLTRTNNVEQRKVVSEGSVPAEMVFWGDS
jgi:hypothetical protein